MDYGRKITKICFQRENTNYVKMLMERDLANLVAFVRLGDRHFRHQGDGF